VCAQNLNIKNTSEEVNEPILSIVTVVLNAASALEQTIKSVIVQTEKIEYIIIDGGSTDGTLDVIKKYEQYITHWVSETDSGIYDAMNKGIKKTTGHYVNFLNAGDTLLSEFVCAEFIKTLDDIEDCICLLCVKRCDGKKIVPKIPQIVRFYRLPTYHQGIIYPREAISRILYSEKYKLVSDFLQYFKLTETECVRLVPILWCQYDTTGVSSVNKKLLHQEFAKAYRELGITRSLIVLRLVRSWLGI
jgi:glycosyltransferase involved in cell wall biosynthesis